MNRQKYLRGLDVLGLTGRGGHARVYKLRNSVTNRYYALKEVGLCNKADLSVVLAESQLLRVRHRNILHYSSLFVSKRPKIISAVKEAEIESRPESGIDANYIRSCMDKDNKVEVYSMEYKESSDCIDDFGINENGKADAFNIEDSMNACRSSYAGDDSERLGCDLEFERTVMKKKCCSKDCNKKNIEKYYNYLLTDYADFTLREYIDKRNDEIFKNEDMSSIPLSKINFIGLEKLNISERGNIQFAHSNLSIPDKFAVDKRESTLGRSNFVNVLSFSSKNNELANRLFKEILQGIVFLHSQGIAHGDLKASNIFFVIEKDYIPMIGDFGCAKCASSSKLQEDVLAAVLIWIEILYPMETVHERVSVLHSIKKRRVLPSEFVEAHYKESLIIGRVLKGELNARSLLKEVLNLTGKNY